MPFASYFLSGEKLTRYNLGAALLCLAGIGLVALDSVEFNIGDVITLAGAVFFAIQMAVTAKYGRKMDIVLDVCGQRRAEPGFVAVIRDPGASVRVDAELYRCDGVSLGGLHMRGSAHPKRRPGACPGFDGLTAPFDGVAFGRVVFGAADGGGAHLAPARRLRAYLPVDYLE